MHKYLLLFILLIGCENNPISNEDKQYSFEILDGAIWNNKTPIVFKASITENDTPFFKLQTDSVL
jgi:hypothetical protein